MIIKLNKACHKIRKDLEPLEAGKNDHEKRKKRDISGKKTMKIAKKTTCNETEWRKSVQNYVSQCLMVALFQYLSLSPIIQHTSTHWQATVCTVHCTRCNWRTAHTHTLTIFMFMRCYFCSSLTSYGLCKSAYVRLVHKEGAVRCVVSVCILYRQIFGYLFSLSLSSVTKFSSIRMHKYLICCVICVCVFNSLLFHIIICALQPENTDEKGEKDDTYFKWKVK